MRTTWWTISGAAIFALATGCSAPAPTDNKPTQAQPVVTQAELCDALSKFFTTELHAPEGKTVPLFPADLSGEAARGGSGMCEIEQGQNIVVSYSARHAPSDPDPTDGRHGYEKKSELGDAVWIYDLRSDPRNPSSIVRFATRINNWNATLEIRENEVSTQSGTLRLTTDDQRRSVRFLTEMTTKLAVDRQPIR
ncbi:hypothetical protein ACFVAV_03245 [Nocardia sp. NPDC057663]|uniref:hypothetical protein n=1 Tax=Nocardia sp. NPDC057663 TaxID=3346201 RepID=UPI00366D0ADE